jgi:hypothetical protein
VNLTKYSLLLACLIANSCGTGEAGERPGKQASAKPIEYQVIADNRYFSKPVALPLGNVTDEQRISFVKELESAIDEEKTKLKEIGVMAEAPGKVVIALYANNVSREICESLTRSEIVQQAATIGFRTFSCQDRTTNHLISLPIKDPRGEIQIVDNPSGIKVVPVP